MYTVKCTWLNQIFLVIKTRDFTVILFGKLYIRLYYKTNSLLYYKDLFNIFQLGLINMKYI